MIPIGYMAKHVATKPDWLRAEQVEEILSVSPCCSDDFAPWIDYWKHNGFWFFDSPEVIVAVAQANKLDLTSTRWFYYEAYEKEYDDDQDLWRDYAADTSFATDVVIPTERRLRGYDLITFSTGSAAECSPLSCNSLADEVPTNRHCLLDTFDDAMKVIDDKSHAQCEPGPYRIFAVYEVPAPPLG